MLALRTIGYGNATPAEFISSLAEAGVEVVCDVRSTPISNRFPAFNKADVELLLRRNNIKYLFMGRELGARPSDEAVYEEGQVKYARLSQSAYYRSGIERLRKGLKTYSVAIMCAEKDPIACHRAILIGRTMVGLNTRVEHIYVPFRLETHEQLEERLLSKFGLNSALMFDLGDDRTAALSRAYSRQEDLIAYRRQRAVT